MIYITACCFCFSLSFERARYHLSSSSLYSCYRNRHHHHRLLLLHTQKQLHCVFCVCLGKNKNIKKHHTTDKNNKIKRFYMFELDE